MNAPSDRLMSDGVALTTSALLNAGTGLIGWLIAARLIPQDEVGAASGFVASFLLVAAIGSLGLPSALLPWVPRSGGHALTLISRIYGVTVLAAITVGLVRLVITPGALRLPETSLTLTAPLFVLMSLLWTMFQLHDPLLTSLRRARLVLAQNVFFSAARLVLLILLTPRLGALGVILAWGIPAALALSVVVPYALARARRAAGSGILPTRGEVLKLTLPTYLAVAFVGFLYNGMPVVVIERLGLEAGAAFFIVWQGLYALDYAATGFVSVLVVSLSVTDDPLRMIGRGIWRLHLVFLPMLGLAALMAPVLLDLFGPGYRIYAQDLLYLVLLAFPARLAVILAIGIHLANRSGVMVAVLQGSSTLGVLGLVLVAAIDSLVDIGIVFLVVQVLVAAFAAGTVAYFSRSKGWRRKDINT